MGRRQTRETRQARVEKLHLDVDRSGVIVAQAVTESTGDDAPTGVGLIEQVDREFAW